MYEKLVEALKGTGIPFAENAWRNAPQTGSYGVIALEMEPSSVWGDNQKIHQAVQGSIDLFVRGRGLSEMLQVQNVLASQEVSWEFNECMYEPAREIMHYEWVFELEMI